MTNVMYDSYYECRGGVGVAPFRVILPKDHTNYLIVKWICTEVHLTEHIKIEMSRVPNNKERVIIQQV